MHKTGMTWFEVQQTPQYVIEQLLLIWDLESIAEKAANRGKNR